MAKTLQIAKKANSLPAKTNSAWQTLPGGSGEISFEAGQISDNVFGATFESSEAGIISWSVTGQALYKGFAGYNADVKAVTQTGTSVANGQLTAFSGRPKVFRSTTSGVEKRVWDPDVAVTVQGSATENGTYAAISDDNYTVNHLEGSIEFNAGYTQPDYIQASFDYFAASASFGKYNDITLTMTSSPIDTTTMPDAATNGGYRTYAPGLRTVNLDATAVYPVGTTTSDFYDSLVGRENVIAEIRPAGASNDDAFARGFFRQVGDSLSGDVGALENEAPTLALNVTEGVVPFDWFFEGDGSRTIPQAVKIALQAWLNEETVFVQYLHDGNFGWAGTAVVSECSMTTGLEAMNEFSITLQGTGTPSARSS